MYTQKGNITIKATRITVYHNYKMRQRNRSRSQTSQESGKGNFKSNAQPSNRLFVSGISSSTSEQEIRKMFESVGNLKDFYLKVPEDPNKRPFAFVQFGSVSQAEKAINVINGKKVGDKMVYVKFANPRTQKDRQGGGFERGQNKGSMNKQQQGYGYGGQRQGYGGNKGKDSQSSRGFERGRDFGNRQNRFQGSRREEGGSYQKRDESDFGGNGFKNFGGKKEVVTTNTEEFDY